MARAKREKWLQMRMNDEELARLDELVAHFKQEDRASLVRKWMMAAEDKMAKEKAKKAKETPR